MRPRLQAAARTKIRAAIEAPLNGRLAVNEEALPFAWIEECPVLTAGSKAVQELREIVRGASEKLRQRTGFPLVLVVIDTLMAAADFNDANDRAEAQKVMNLLRKIADEFKVLVLVVDHFGKDESKGTAGASSKEAAADTVLAALCNKTIAGKVSNTRLALRKVRGGKQGGEISYWTRQVFLGLDADGDIVDTLIVEWGDASEAGKCGSDKLEWPKTLQGFRVAIERCMKEHGARARPKPDGEEVRVVDREIVRTEFMRTYSAGKSNTKAKAFVRKEAEALSSGLIGAREIEFRGRRRSVVWISASKSEGVGGETESELSGMEAGQDT